MSQKCAAMGLISEMFNDGEQSRVAPGSQKLMKKNVDCKRSVILVCLMCRINGLIYPYPL